MDCHEVHRPFFMAFGMISTGGGGYSCFPTGVFFLFCLYFLCTILWDLYPTV